jgi:hypothetical protein
VTKRRGPSPEPRKNREEPGRPSGPPPPLPGHGDATGALPEATTADGGAALSQEAKDRLHGNLDADPRAADWLRPWVGEGWPSYEDWAAAQAKPTPTPVPTGEGGSERPETK